MAIILYGGIIMVSGGALNNINHQ